MLRAFAASSDPKLVEPQSTVTISVAPLSMSWLIAAGFWAIAFKDAIGNIDAGRHAEMREKAVKQRRGRRAVDVVVAEDRHGPRPTLMAQQALRGLLAVGQQIRIRHQAADGRVKEGHSLVEADAAASKNAGNQIRQAVGLGDGQRLVPGRPGRAGNQRLPETERSTPRNARRTGSAGRSTISPRIGRPVPFLPELASIVRIFLWPLDADDLRFTDEITFGLDRGDRACAPNPPSSQGDQDDRLMMGGRRTPRRGAARSIPGNVVFRHGEVGTLAKTPVRSRTVRRDEIAAPWLRICALR